MSTSLPNLFMSRLVSRQGRLPSKRLNMSTVPATKPPSPSTAAAPAQSSSSSSSSSLSSFSLAGALGSGSLASFGLWRLSNTRCHQDDHEDYMGHIIHL
mmetsp:Transcript_13747/g.26972  ORF Transcript_13747/g.26972 Transcript_13747/m.26972 type:complete len:99 (-) Transcript_13747:309-605(-)